MLPTRRPGGLGILDHGAEGCEWSYLRPPLLLRFMRIDSAAPESNDRILIG